MEACGACGVGVLSAFGLVQAKVCLCKSKAEPSEARSKTAGSHMALSATHAAAEPGHSDGPLDNLLMLDDPCKATRHLRYPARTETICSYFECCDGAYQEVCFFGLQYYLKRYLVGPVVTYQRISEAETYIKAHFSHAVGGCSEQLFNRCAWEHILTVHGGKLPVVIKAVPEGTAQPCQRVLFTVENTDPQCSWLTTYLESLLSQVWYHTMVCTHSREQKRIIRRYLREAGSHELVERGEHLFKLHDFGFCGVSSAAAEPAAGAAGAAHLMNFLSSDTLVALGFAKEYYGEPCAGGRTLLEKALGNAAKQGAFRCSHVVVGSGGEGRRPEDELVEVFRDGELLVDDTLEAIRKRSDGACPGGEECMSELGQCASRPSEPTSASEAASAAVQQEAATALAACQQAEALATQEREQALGSKLKEAQELMAKKEQELDELQQRLAEHTDAPQSRRADAADTEVQLQRVRREAETEELQERHRRELAELGAERDARSRVEADRHAQELQAARAQLAAFKQELQAARAQLAAFKQEFAAQAENRLNQARRIGELEAQCADQEERLQIEDGRRDDEAKASPAPCAPGGSPDDARLKELEETCAMQDMQLEELRRQAEDQAERSRGEVAAARAEAEGLQEAMRQVMLSAVESGQDSEDDGADDAELDHEAGALAGTERQREAQEQAAEEARSREAELQELRQQLATAREEAVFFKATAQEPAFRMNARLDELHSEVHRAQAAFSAQASRLSEAELGNKALTVRLFEAEQTAKAEAARADEASKAAEESPRRQPPAQKGEKLPADRLEVVCALGLRLVEVQCVPVGRKFLQADALGDDLSSSRSALLAPPAVEGGKKADALGDDLSSNRSALLAPPAGVGGGEGGKKADALGDELSSSRSALLAPPAGEGGKKEFSKRINKQEMRALQNRLVAAEAKRKEVEQQMASMRQGQEEEEEPEITGQVTPRLRAKSQPPKAPTGRSLELGPQQRQEEQIRAAIGGRHGRSTSDLTKQVDLFARRSPRFESDTESCTQPGSADLWSARSTIDEARSTQFAGSARCEPTPRPAPPPWCLSREPADAGDVVPVAVEVLGHVTTPTSLPTASLAQGSAQRFQANGRFGERRFLEDSTSALSMPQADPSSPYGAFRRAIEADSSSPGAAGSRDLGSPYDAGGYRLCGTTTTFNFGVKSATQATFSLSPVQQVGDPGFLFSPAPRASAYPAASQRAPSAGPPPIYQANPLGAALSPHQASPLGAALSPHAAAMLPPHFQPTTPTTGTTMFPWSPSSFAI